MAFYKQLLTHDPCAYCGEPAPLGRYGGHEIDHIHERRLGGANHWTNYTAACRFCNLAKWNMVLGQLLVLCDLRLGIVPVAGEGFR